MEKRLRSSTSSSSADEILSSAVSLAATKTGKSSLRSVIFSLPASSDLVATLPPALHLSISRSLDAFKNSLRACSSASAAALGRSSRSPPTKRSRPSSRAQIPEAAGAEGSDDPISPETLDHLRNLKAYAFVAHLCVSHPKNLFAPSVLLPSVRSLHDGLVLYEWDPALLSQVASLCEEWWKANLPGRENLVSQSLPFLLSSSLTEGKKGDVRRVYALREAFLLFDYVDESIEDMKTLLVRCVITPVYLKMEEGRKFVAFMLGLNGQLMKESLVLMKSQIPFGRKSVLEAYADILFRAWKGSEESLREEIEVGFLQGLIEGAIHASSKLLAASVRRVLGGFIEQRMTVGVEKLLLRLVEPVLFRSLQVANSNVRQNALHLLLDVFPLEDPDATNEVKDSLLNKQFFLLEKLLLDDCPEVRSVVVEGSCRILHLFWEIIPSSTITKFLAKIVDSMSIDICYEVRMSSINGIIYLLHNPQSHEVMKVLLPRLGSLFSDPVLSVRVAVVDLLLAVRDLRTIQFNKVVGLNNLLSALANDHPRVASKITKLLIPSYFPSKLSIKEACSRCVALIRRSPDAGARFCEFALSEGSSPRSLMELARVCVTLALSPKGLVVEQIDGLLVASSNICQCLSSELSVKRALSELLSAKKFKHLLTAANSERAQTAILSIASVVPTEKLGGIYDSCMVIIRNSTGLSDNVERQGVVKSAQKLIISCGWFDEMFEELANILQDTASNFRVRFGLGSTQQILQTSKKKKVKLPMKISSTDQVTGKGSQDPGTSSDDKDFAVAAAAAWQVKSLLASETTRNAVLKSSVSEMAFSALGVISEVCIQQCMQLKQLDTEPLMAYTTFALSMSSQNVGSTTTNDVGGVKDNDFHQKRSSVEENLDHALDHIVNCADKFFSEHASGKPNQNSEYGVETSQRQKSKRKEAQEGIPNSTEGDQVASFEVKRIENLVMLYMAIMKFVVDAETMRHTNQNHGRYLKFASDHIRHIVSVLKRHKHQKSSNQEEALKDKQDECFKDIITYLKSSFSYAAKLLHLVLKCCNESSAPSPEAFYLANDLLDLITSVEMYVGSRHASNVVSVAKSWLPILILGLGCNQLMMSEKESNLKLADLVDAKFPVWLSVLGKIELHRDGDLSQYDDNQTPKLQTCAFENLIEMLLILLKKGSPRILDAVGVVILAGLEVALKRADFSLVFGLAHFTCMKMFGNESAPLEELELTSSSLQKIYQRIEQDLRDHHINKDGRHQLESAHSLIQSLL
ncbi:Condensin II non structural maintenance of chromosomes subunit [Musa troglodytarum]|uniref:Condensin II non structural maintenance of chromosomes subunit n=1 Tax=Musa troglodytarum TaxID=320322 RepID=A0A9E7HM74_9LILI|nr:Condensin II non structural maintenance of chromosomes subunit [Musa troglodytarum]